MEVFSYLSIPDSHPESSRVPAFVNSHLLSGRFSMMKVTLSIVHASVNHSSKLTDFGGIIALLCCWLPVCVEEMFAHVFPGAVSYSTPIVYALVLKQCGL